MGTILSNVLRQEVPFRQASKPSPSAFAGSLRHGSSFIVPSVGAFIGLKSGLLRRASVSMSLGNDVAIPKVLGPESP